MTILGNFTRRKNREKLIKVRSTGPPFRRRYFQPKHQQDTKLKSPIQRHLLEINISSDPIEISSETARAMELEFLELSSKTNVSSLELANALAGSRKVMDCHGSIKKKQNPLKFITKGLGVLSFRSSKLSEDSLKRRYELINALNRVEKQPSSTVETLSSWEDAKQKFSSIINFPSHDEDDDTNEKVNSSQVEVKEEYINQFHDILGGDHFERKPYTSKWRQVASYPIPSKLGDDVDDVQEATTDTNRYASSLEEADKKFILKTNIAADSLENRLKSKALREMEERLLEAEREEEARNRASALMRELTPEESETVEDAIYGIGSPGDVVAITGNDSVQRSSIQTLQPGQWLGDEVITYFYLMLSKRDEDLCEQDASRKRSHFFKSFFMTKLLNVGHADPAMEGQYEYRNVKRWSKKVPGKNIFNLDKVFFPINQGGMHWLCAVAFVTEKRIQVYDSMGSGGQHYLDSIFQYLQDEHLDKKKCPLPDIDQWQLVPCKRDTPQQRNGFDCGVFTCMFADFLSKDCPLIFSQEHITQCRERIALSIMSGKAIM